MEQLHPALPGGALARRKLDPGNEPEVAQVNHVARRAQRMKRVLPALSERAGALEQGLVAIDVECRDPCRRSKRMARIGIAVE